MTEKPEAHTFDAIWDEGGALIAHVNFKEPVRTPLELQLDMIIDKLDKIIELLK